jgi:hypothetical protein
VGRLNGREVKMDVAEAIAEVRRSSLESAAKVCEQQVVRFTREMEPRAAIASAICAAAIRELAASLEKP